MPIPSYQQLFRPLLAAIEDGRAHQMADLHERLSTFFELTQEEIQRRLPSGRQTYFRNRLGWARTYLGKAGLIEIPARGSCKITDRGRQALVDCPNAISNAYLRQYPEFLEFTRGSRETADRSQATTTDNDLTPEERLRSAHAELKDTLADQLLTHIKQCSPQFFERLVVDLMLAMGYGGTAEDAGLATQYSADGGIDGIIKQDPLGLDSIYLQAKRYTENTIGRPEIQKFCGALDMCRAKKGVFITTSRFSQEAQAFVGMIEKKIILIDGDKLTDLMITYGLGTSVKETLTLQAIDSDYFSEDD
ncbi:restriction endonuclease [Microbulbifer sp. TRSA007]|uniref:restriction endonuclease n=1 Tax=Microbulbifer sp. TRSA007 TaxID=3243384 RepID=UPI00403971F4